MYRIELRGLDGSNLLAYLAALGVLRVLAAENKGTRMSWEDAGYWTPVVHHPVLADQGRLVDALARRLSGESSINPAWMVAPDLTLSISQFRDSAAHARRRANPDNRDEVDYLAAFGSEAHGIGPKRSQISMTPFRCLAGQQRFLDFIRELASGTTVEHLDRTLFHPWTTAMGHPQCGGIRRITDRTPFVRRIPPRTLFGPCVSKSSSHRSSATLSCSTAAEPAGNSRLHI